MFTLNDTLHMHQTGAIGSGYVFGTSLHVMPYLITSHADGYSLLFDCKHTAETTTFVHVAGFKHFNPLDHLEQIAQFIEIRYVQFTRSR